jgi:hypothetical protein
MSLQKYGKYALKKYPAVRKRARVYVPAVRQLASDVMYLKGLINSEPKNHYVTDSNNFDYNGVMVSLSSISSTGTEAYARDGNRVLPRYLKLRMHINKSMTSAIPHNTFRYILFRWWGESPNTAGVAPAVTDIIAGTGTQFAPLSPLVDSITGSKGDRTRRIEVHRTGFVTLDQVGKTSFDFDLNLELNGKGKSTKEHIEFYGDATAPPTSGGFFMLFVSDNVTAADLSYQLYSHLTFYDN